MNSTLRNKEKRTDCDGNESSSHSQIASSRMSGNPTRARRLATPLSFHFSLGPLRIQNMRLASLRVKGYESATEWLNEDRHIFVGRKVPCLGLEHTSIFANPFKYVL